MIATIARWVAAARRGFGINTATRADSAEAHPKTTVWGGLAGIALTAFGIDPTWLVSIGQLIARIGEAMAGAGIN